jgi:Transcriptional regulator of heat shock gene
MTQDAADRSKRVLAALVREYIESGEPVASSLLVTAAGLGVSSATVRSILSRLEEEGYVQQPHTSAGRIPTDRGYRFYVDLLLDAKRPNRQATAVEARLRRESPNGLLDSLLPQVSHLLSQASRGMGFAVRPAHEAAVFDRVEFVPLSALRVLVVIVASGGHVIQKVIELAEPLGADELRQAANYLNEEFSGLPLHRAREAVLERIVAEQSLYDALRQRALQLATSTFSDLPTTGRCMSKAPRRCSTMRPA